MAALTGIRVVSLAINLPGPMAAQRLTQLGATVIKVEPPSGDPLARDYAELYRKLSSNQQIVVLDLKTEDGKAALDKLLASTDLLLTSSRPRALQKLGLDWDDLHRRFSRLCHVSIVGFPPPDVDLPAHDLNFQAAAGLLEPPQLPNVLLADRAGSERAVSAALALLLDRERSGTAGFEMVSISEAVAGYADSIRHGLTRNGGLLRGGSPVYDLYQTRSGWIAVAALENVFIEKLKKVLELTEIDRKSLAEIFRVKSATEWEDWGRQNDLPITAVIKLEY